MMRVLQRVSLVLVALLSTIATWAQVSFKADVPAITALGQPFRVEFSVDAEPERNSFKAPEFAGFDVLAGPSVSTGHSVQFINGKKSAKKTGYRQNPASVLKKKKKLLFVFVTTS